MNLERRAWVIARVAIVLLALVSLRIVYWQLWRGYELRPTAVVMGPAYTSYQPWVLSFLRPPLAASTPPELADLPRPVVQRTIHFLSSITRGNIYDRGGSLLATDRVDDSGRSHRHYSEPSLAHTLGYVSGIGTGVNGLEWSYNQSLLGLDRNDAAIARMLNQPITGSDLVLTIDANVQRAADAALGGRAGAVVVLDGRNGAVLASASAPRFDPNRILEGGYAAGLDTSGSPFLNRATQAVYSPGSTWKTLALIAALDTGQIRPDTVFDFGEPVTDGSGTYYVYRVDGGVIPDPNHRERQLTTTMSFARSANAAFARIGDEMPPETLLDYAARYGFGAPGELGFPLDVETTPSQVANDPAALVDNNLLRAATAVGQGELLASPLQMGMVVLSVLNDGSMPMPYWVDAIVEPDGSRFDQLPNRRIFKRLMKPETANQVKQIMVTAVSEGSGRAAQVTGAVVGGKTGTAQLGGGQAPHAWFVGFAERGNQSVVVVVMLEHGGQGSQAAAPIFAQSAEAALRALESQAE